MERLIRKADAEKPPWNDQKMSFFIDGYSEIIERTMAEVIRAEYWINRFFILRGYATYREFLEMLDIQVDERKMAPWLRGETGWDNGLGEVVYGYKWIEFYHTNSFIEDGMMIVMVNLPFRPHDISQAAYEEACRIYPQSPPDE